MPSPKTISATFAAALLLSGVNAGPCKPSSPGAVSSPTAATGTTSPNAVTTPTAVNSLPANTTPGGETTPIVVVTVPTPIIPETPIVVVPTPIVDPKTPIVTLPTPVVPETPIVVIPTPIVDPKTPIVVVPTPIVDPNTPIVVVPLPTPVIPETPIVVVPTPTPTPGGSNDEDELCYLPRVLGKRNVSLDPCQGETNVDDGSGPILATRTGLSLEECATEADNYAYRLAVRIGYDAQSSTCYLFSEAELLRSRIPQSSRVFPPGTLAYDLDCFTCPSDEPPVTIVPPEPVCRLSTVTKRLAVQKCGEEGTISSSTPPLDTYAGLEPEECALMCSETDGCLTFTLSDSDECKLYAQTPSTLGFSCSAGLQAGRRRAVSGAGETPLTIYQQSCFTCDTVAVGPVF